MAQVKLVNYDEASAEVRTVFDDIMKTRNTDYINNIWRALASNPAVLKRFWGQMKAVMVKPSRLDPLTKELIYLAVSINNNCDYCINSHTFAARKHGLDDEMLTELYYAALSRPPFPEEREKALAHVSARPDKRKAWEDVLWALINTREFLFRH